MLLCAVTTTCLKLSCCIAYLSFIHRISLQIIRNNRTIVWSYNKTKRLNYLLLWRALIWPQFVCWIGLGLKGHQNGFENVGDKSPINCSTLQEFKNIGAEKIMWKTSNSWTNLGDVSGWHPQLCWSKRWEAFTSLTSTVSVQTHGPFYKFT